MHKNIFEIARLIRQKPSISARGVAEALGYAEPKSIYYWLGKIGFTFKEFKEAVLSGVFPDTAGTFEEGLAPYAQGLPVLERFTADGQPVFADRKAPFDWPGAHFAISWSGPPYAPQVAPGDWVVVGPQALSARQMILLLDDEGALALARLIDEGSEPLFVEISFERTWRAPYPPLVGRVASVIKVP